MFGKTGSALDAEHAGARSHAERGSEHPAFFLFRRKIRMLWGILLGLCLLWNSYSILICNGYLLGYDNNFYFAWARSMVLDRDLDFQNDLGFVAENKSLGETSRVIADFLNTTPKTANGYIPNKYGMGMGLLALPSLYLGNAVFHLYGLISGFEVKEFSRSYPWIFALNAILFGFLGVAGSYRLLARLYGQKTAFGAVSTGLLGLPLGYYIWYEPTMSHAMSFAIATLYIGTVIHWAKILTGHRQNQAWRPLLLTSIAMGFLLGISCTIRYTNLVFAIVPFVLAASILKANEADRTHSLSGVLSLCLPGAFAGALAGFFPQLLAWKQIYGSWFLYTYQGEGMSVWPEHAFDILFGLRNSLFVWSPLAMIAIAGLCMGAFKRNPLALSGLIVFLGFVWIYGSWECYWLGNSYGMRGLVDCSFFFLLGFAEIFSRLRAQNAARRWLKKLTAAGIMLLIIWNLYFLFCYRSFLQPHGEPFAGLRLLAEPERPLKQLLADMGLGGAVHLSR